MIDQVTPIFTHPGLNLHPGPQDKPYDVFLSYSHEDSDWVEQYLAEGLEKPVGEDVMHYKCCIHTRDWKVGEMIPDQIVQSVESSRRTLIVLSKAYIESMWTKLEFRAAHTQALQDKTQRVILVVRGSLPERGSMEEDLQRYISLNTYLDSEDPWFWHKLRWEESNAILMTAKYYITDDELLIQI
jgi:protein toll